MRFPTSPLFLSMAVLAVLLIPYFASAELPELEGLFGLSNVNETTALAFWVPLGEGDSVSGIQWFNSDGDIVFPEFLAVAGDAEHPELLQDATTVAHQVTGESLSWCEFSFDQPLATTANGLYLIWQLPAGCVFTEAGTGGGAGFGVTAGGAANKCWVTSDGLNWDSFTVSHQMAVRAVMTSNKSEEALVLSKPGSRPASLRAPELKEEKPFSIQIVAVPNPFNPSTKISFSLPKSDETVISVYDVRGRLVRSLFSGFLVEGFQEVNWDGTTQEGRTASSGLYFVRISTDDIHQSIRITLTK